MRTKLFSSILALTLAAGLGLAGNTAAFAQGVATGDETPTVVVQGNPRPPAEAFARYPAMRSVAISPTAKMMAWVDNNTIVTYDLATGEENRLAPGANIPIALRWASDKRLIVTIRTQTKREDYYQAFDFVTDLVLDEKAKYLGPLFESREKGKPSPHGAVMRYVYGENPTAYLLGVDSEGYRPGLSTATASQYVTALYKVDINTGKRTVVERGNDDTAVMSMDENEVVRVRVSVKKAEINYGARRVVIEYRRTPTSNYEILDLPDDPNIQIRAAKYSQTDNGVFWTQYNRKEDRSEIYLKSFDSNEVKLFASGDGQNIDVIIREKDAKRVGITKSDGRDEFEWTDPEYKAMYATFNKLFPGQDIRITSRTDDEKLTVFVVTSASQPPVYYLYDHVANTVEPVGEAYPELKGALLGETEFVTYKSRDGLDIPAYVTMRKGLKTPAPAIVLVHGGPASRDNYGYDYEVQFLANRGFIVIQPQYRGSTGFGEAFQRAGDKQWGRAMNNDLVDAANYLVDKGLADKSKICVKGWSYGGYATMAAVTLTPDVWACGIEGAGVSHPIRMIDWVSEREGGAGVTGEEETGTNYWKRVIGDPRYEADKIREISPALHVDGMKAPLLLFHGDKDIIVPLEQSQIMYDAMQKAGKKGRMIILKGEDHNQSLYESRVIFLKETETFLDEVIGKQN